MTGPTQNQRRNYWKAVRKTTFIHKVNKRLEIVLASITQSEKPCNSWDIGKIQVIPGNVMASEYYLEKYNLGPSHVKYTLFVIQSKIKILVSPSVMDRTMRHMIVRQ